jgi:hypothetical protein
VKGWAAKVRAHGEQVGKRSKPRKPKAEVQSTWTQVRAPSGTDPGEVVAVHFIVDDGVLILTNEEGAAIKEVKEYRLLPSDDPVSLARAFTRERRKLRDPDGFNRPLNHPPLGIA